MRTSGFDSHGPIKQWIEITSCDPTSKTIQGKSGDGGPISISINDVPTAFRWPKTGEWWSVCRDPINNFQWNLDSRIPGRTTQDQDGQLAITLNEISPITELNAGEVRIDGEVITDSANNRLLATGKPLQLPTYLVATRPDATVNPGCVIFVSDASSGNRFQGSNGITWLSLG